MNVPITIKLTKYNQYRGPRLVTIGSITFTHPSNVMIWNNVVNEVEKDDQCSGSAFLKRWYPTIAYMKKRIESRIIMLNMLGIERTSVDTIARSSVDFVISLVILSSLTSLAIVENWPAVGKRDRIMIVKSKQFQASLKYLCGLGYNAISLNTASMMKTATTRLWIKLNVPTTNNWSSLPTERMAGVASRARASAWSRITPVIELLPLISSQTYCLLQCLVQDQQLYSHLFLMMMMMMTIVRIEGCEMMISFFPSAYLSTHFSMLFFSKVLVSFLHCSIFSSILSHSCLAGRYFSIISVFHFSSLRRSVPSSIKFLMDSARLSW